MPLLADWRDRLSLPVLCSPMFLASGPELVIAQCKSGVIGSFPAVNARPESLVDEWLHQIQEALQAGPPGGSAAPAPFAVNQIVHVQNKRLENDLATCAEHKVQLIITSLGARADYIKGIHDWGGIVFHDVTNMRHAHKALEAGVDGLILVCAGAGGHGGTLSPFALLSEVRRIYSGPVVLAGAISRGDQILAARVLGADLVYMGTRFIATRESMVDARYKQMLVDSHAADILYTPIFSGVSGNYLKHSISAVGLDPDNLPDLGEPNMKWAPDGKRAWKDIWSAGQGVGSIDDAPSVAELVQRLKSEYTTAQKNLSAMAMA